MTRPFLLSMVACAAIAAVTPAALATPAPGTLVVAAASDLRDALPALIKASGHPELKPTFGSSGKLYAQIVAGAPFDAFFSADGQLTRKLEAAGRIRPGSRFAYGVGRLVLWAPATSHVEVTRGLMGLADPAVKQVAIANPEHAPYGRAAVQALRRAKVWEAVSPKLVLGENVSQAAQFAGSGAADVGILARSLMRSPVMAAGNAWPVPASWHEPLIQEAVVLRDCAQPKPMAAFMAFVASPAGRQVLAAYGFEAP